MIKILFIYSLWYTFKIDCIHCPYRLNIDLNVIDAEKKYAELEYNSINEYREFAE